MFCASFRGDTWGLSDEVMTVGPHRAGKRLIEAALAQVPVSPAKSSCMRRSPPRASSLFLAWNPDQIGAMTTSVVTAEAEDGEREAHRK